MELTPAAARAAAEYLLAMHECISHEDLAEACERAASVLLLHAKEQERHLNTTALQPTSQLYRAAAEAAHLCAIEGFTLDGGTDPGVLSELLEELADQLDKA